MSLSSRKSPVDELDHLSRMSRRAAEMLYFCTFLAEAPIPVDLLLAGSGLKEIQLFMWLGEWLVISQDKKYCSLRPAVDNLVRTHMLAKEQADPEFNSKINQLVKRMIPLVLSALNEHQVADDYLEHAKTLLWAIKQNNDDPKLYDDLSAAIIRQLKLRGMAPYILEAALVPTWVASPPRRTPLTKEEVSVLLGEPAPAADPVPPAQQAITEPEKKAEKNWYAWGRTFFPLVATAVFGTNHGRQLKK